MLPGCCVISILAFSGNVQCGRAPDSFLLRRKGLWACFSPHFCLDDARCLQFLLRRWASPLRNFFCFSACCQLTSFSSDKYFCPIARHTCNCDVRQGHHAFLPTRYCGDEIQTPAINCHRPPIKGGSELFTLPQCMALSPKPSIDSCLPVAWITRQSNTQIWTWRYSCSRNEGLPTL